MSTQTVTLDIAPGPSTLVVDLAKPGVSYPSQPLTVSLVGVAGPPGPAGTAGGSVETYALAAVSSFDAAHSFSTPPDATLVDASGVLVETDVSYSSGHVYLSFPSPFTGTLYLS